MKLTIELNDHDLKASIEKQLERVVASVTEQLISVKVNEIVDKKLARVNDSDLQQAMTEACHQVLETVLGSRSGNTWERNRKVQAYLTDAAVATIKAAAK